MDIVWQIHRYYVNSYPQYFLTPQCGGFVQLNTKATVRRIHIIEILADIVSDHKKMINLFFNRNMVYLCTCFQDIMEFGNLSEQKSQSCTRSRMFPKVF